MIYFKNSQDEVFARSQSDIDHDLSVKQSIADIEQQITDLQNSGDEYAATKIEALQTEIATLQASIRISDELVQITEAEKDELLRPSDEQLALQSALTEHLWVKSELDNVQVQIMYHWTGDDGRSQHTEQAWKDYAIALRNYTTTDAGSNPQVVGESRPSIDSYL